MGTPCSVNRNREHQISTFERTLAPDHEPSRLGLKAYQGKSVMVAGGTGMIGRPLTRLLLAVGAKVTVAGIESPQVAKGILPSEVRYIQADFTEIRDAQIACEGQNYVFNLVGIKGSVGIGESKAASYLIPMLRFQTNLTEASFRAGVEGFLFVSSINVYPPADLHFEQNAWKGEPVQNDRIPGIGKRVGEIVGLAMELEHKWEAFRIVRPANVFGPFDVVDPLRSQVIPALIRKFLSSENQVSVWGSGETIRDFVFSEDMAYWFALAMLNVPTNYPVNLGSGGGVSIAELATTVARLTNFQGHVEFDSTRPSGDQVRLLDITRAKTLLDYKNLTPLEHGLAKTIDWMRSVL